MTDPAPALVVARRYRGPPGTANGGFVCGLLAAHLQRPTEAPGPHEQSTVAPEPPQGPSEPPRPPRGAVEVTLRRPVPLERPLGLRHDPGGMVVVEEAGVLVAEARPVGVAVELAVPEAVGAEAARAVAGTSRYYDAPYFPDCFVCGPLRAAGDGLRIFPGPLAGQRLWAAPWTPDPSVAGPDGRVRAEVVWASLDCPSGIAAGEAAALGADAAILLGRMTASVAATPRPGDTCPVVAWLVGRDGRKLLGASALLGPGGAVLAAARTVWLTVPLPGGR
jgi:hypothetical protein